MKHKHGAYVPLSQLVKTTASQIEDAYHQRRPPHTLRYGFHALDEITTGIHPGDFVAVVSDSPDLSTALLLSTVHSLSVTDGVPVRFISARHDETYLTTQLLSIESGIGIIELRSGMLQPVHFSALTDSARVLYDAPLQLAAVDAVSLEESLETFNQITTSEPIVVDGFPMYHRSDELVLRRLRDTATDQECPVIISAQATTNQREEWRFDRWFDVILRVRISEVNNEPRADHEESIEVEIIKNRHGTVGTVYLEYTPQNGLVGDIDAERVSMADLHASLEKINAHHGETLRRLGEGHSEEGTR